MDWDSAQGSLVATPWTQVKIDAQLALKAAKMETTELSQCLCSFPILAAMCLEFLALFQLAHFDSIWPPILVRGLLN